MLCVDAALRNPFADNQDVQNGRIVSALNQRLDMMIRRAGLWRMPPASARTWPDRSGLLARLRK
jgi:hypothetical protein